MAPENLLRAALAAACLFPALLSPRVAGGDVRGRVTFISPVHGSLVAGGKVTLAGSLPPGVSEASFRLNGRPLAEVTRRGPVFSAPLSPARGFNEVEVRVPGGPPGRLTFVAGMTAAGKRPYRYHRPLEDEICEPCHTADGGRAVGDSALCYRCHGTRAVMYTNVHGPVAAGRCLICHDPHGSSLAALTRLDTRDMCTHCHDQLSTARHTSERTRVCTICHNPHYSMKKYLLKDRF